MYIIEIKIIENKIQFAKAIKTIKVYKNIIIFIEHTSPF